MTQILEDAAIAWMNTLHGEKWEQVSVALAVRRRRRWLIGPWRYCAYCIWGKSLRETWEGKMLEHVFRDYWLPWANNGNAPWEWTSASSKPLQIVMWSWHHGIRGLLPKDKGCGDGE